MPKVKINYSVGDVLGIPLRDGSNKFARCVVARMDGKGMVFGYFFPPAKTDQDVLVGMEPENAILLGNFGDLGIAIQKTWLIFGRVENFNDQKWSYPEYFYRVDSISGRITLVHHNQETFETEYEKQFDADEVDIDKYPKDGLMGSGYVEIKLTMILNPKWGEKYLQDQRQ